MKKINELKKNDFFKRKDGAKKVFILNGYCRINKAYEATNYDDISEFIYLKKGKEVFTNFEY
jgi:hypothetical protein